MFRFLAKLRSLLSGGDRVQESRRPPNHAPVSSGEFVYELPFSCGSRFGVLQGYGGSYSHTERSHYSLDFRMPENTPVCAARGGIVYRVVSHFSLGGTHPSFKPRANVIDVLHVDDTIASYVHLVQNGTLVRPGQIVRAGQIIGYSGNTGWSGCPHLHFHVADAFYHERIPTLFNTFEGGAVLLEVNTAYTRPGQCNLDLTRPTHNPGRNDQHVELHRDPYVFSPELLVIRNELIVNLSTAGFEVGCDYSSVDVLHDVHGIEVCGIRDPDQAMQVTRMLIRLFPGWTPGWLHAPDTTSHQGWVATIQRNCAQETECWETD